MNRREAIKTMLMTGAAVAAPSLGIGLSSLTAATIPMEKQGTGNDINHNAMKVLMLNGSPRKEGCTFTAVKEVAGALEKEGIASEILHIGDKAVSGCRACGACHRTGRCVVDDKVNEVIERVDEFDGLIVGSPVHYAAASGFITPFLDRLFFAASGRWAFKPGAAVVSCRRAGSTAALDQLNKYFTISQMPVVSSQYWNMVHGHTPDDVRKDEEGMQIMRTLGRNMAWMLKCFAARKAAGIGYPAPEEPRKITNFIR